MILAHVADNFVADGVNIAIVLRGESKRILRIESGHERWEEAGPPAVYAEPTMILSHEAARALLDGLLHHYEGSSDQRQARQDLLHERQRVDTLMEALIDIAKEGTL